MAGEKALNSRQIPTIPLTQLATQAANTVLANQTAGAAVPTAVVMAASTILARLAAGNIVAATSAEMKTLLGYLQAGDALGTPASGNLANCDKATPAVDGLMSAVDKTKLNGIEAAADVTDAGNIATAINGTAETTPLDADEFPFWKAVGTVLKKVLWSTIKSTLKTYFDTLYAYAGHITLLPAAYKTQSGSWGFNVNALFPFNGGWANGAGANGNYITWNCVLQAATYTALLWANTENNRGIATLSIDGVDIVSWDMYSAGQVVSVRFEKTDIAVATTGLKEIKLRVNGKNGSSSGYYMVPHSLTLYRTT